MMMMLVNDDDVDDYDDDDEDDPVPSSPISFWRQEERKASDQKSKLSQLTSTPKSSSSLHASHIHASTSTTRKGWAGSVTPKKLSEGPTDE